MFSNTQFSVLARVSALIHALDGRSQVVGSAFFGADAHDIDVIATVPHALLPRLAERLAELGFTDRGYRTYYTASGTSWLGARFRLDGEKPIELKVSDRWVFDTTIAGYVHHATLKNSDFEDLRRALGKIPAYVELGIALMAVRHD